MPSIDIPAEVFKDITLPHIVVAIKVPYGMCDICAKKVWWFQKAMKVTVSDPDDKGTTYTHSRHTRCFKRAELAAQRRYSDAVARRAMQSVEITFRTGMEDDK